MIRNSQIVRSVRETVSLETLEKKLPPGCYDAVLHHLSEPTKNPIDESIYHQYFSAEATPVLNEDEKKELFDRPCWVFSCPKPFESWPFASQADG